MTVGNSSTADLAIYDSSDLILEINGLAGGWVFRWANPGGGDHLADLQNLISGGEITFSYLNGGSYALTSGAASTYVSVIGVPGPSSLLLVVAVAAVAAGICRRRMPRT